MQAGDRVVQNSRFTGFGDEGVRLQEFGTRIRCQASHRSRKQAGQPTCPVVCNMELVVEHQKKAKSIVKDNHRKIEQDTLPCERSYSISRHCSVACGDYDLD